MIYQHKECPDEVVFKRWSSVRGHTIGNYAEYDEELIAPLKRSGFLWDHYSRDDDDELLGKLEVPKEFLE